MKLIKLLLILMVSTTLSLKSFSQEIPLNQRISISFSMQPIKKVIKRIEKESQVSFAYSNVPALDQKVSGSFTNQTISEVLIDILQETNLSFKMVAGKILLFERKKNPNEKEIRSTIHGYIYDQASGERLINANVYNPDNYVGTISNNYGFYSYSAPIGMLKLEVTYMGYQTQTFHFDLENDTTLNISLQAKSDELGEVTIIGTQTNKVEDTQMSMNDLSVQKLTKVPVILGEADVLKVIQMLPGVHAGTEGTSSIYVRGGGPDQNLFLLDGVPVYNAAHLFGFFSVFNPDAIKSVKLYKGGFPARFGDRLSSVVDVAMKDGNMKELHGNVSVGIIASKLQMEGPLVKDKTSFMLSVRRSYIDLLAQPFLMSESKSDNKDISGLAHFHDFNLKINQIFSDRSRLYWSGYHGRDAGKGTEIRNYYSNNNTVKEQVENSIGAGWGNTLSSLRWNYLISPRLFSNTTFIYSKFFFDIESQRFDRDLEKNTRLETSYKYNSGIEDLCGKIDFDYFPNSTQFIKFGAQYTHHHFTPGASNAIEKYENIQAQNIDSVFGNREIYANEFSAYFEDDISFNASLKANMGIRISAYLVDGKTYVRPQPRISLRYKVKDNWSFKGSYSRMVQHVHLLTTSNIDLPTDLWVPVTKHIEPPVSDQLALGTAISIQDGINLTIEGYYKKMKNIIAYKEGASFIDSSNEWETKVEKGDGTSYGMEFMLEKTVGKTSGWIGYTLSKTTHQFDEINFGKPFPAKYDRRHDINVVVSHKFNDHFDISGSWVYGTGNAVSLSLSKVPIANIPYSHGRDEYTPYYPGRNNYRMPAYHRMDIGMNFHKKKKRGIRTWNISAYNAYNRKNAFLLMWLENGDTMSADLGGEQKLTKISIFPIIPSVSYFFKF
ncbi:MAG: TonB-dependent receptor domain-containing protein [Prolixibacteraceae bacterium]